MLEQWVNRLGWIEEMWHKTRISEQRLQCVTCSYTNLTVNGKEIDNAKWALAVDAIVFSGWKELLYLVCSPVICLSGKGGTDIHVNFSTKRSNSQSKCLYLLLTTIPVFQKTMMVKINKTLPHLFLPHIHRRLNPNPCLNLTYAGY